MHASTDMEMTLSVVGRSVGLVRATQFFCGRSTTTAVFTARARGPSRGLPYVPQTVAYKRFRETSLSRVIAGGLIHGLKSCCYL